MKCKINITIFSYVVINKMKAIHDTTYFSSEIKLLLFFFSLIVVVFLILVLVFLRKYNTQRLTNNDRVTIFLPSVLFPGYVSKSDGLKNEKEKAWTLLAQDQIYHQ